MIRDTITLSTKIKIRYVNKLLKNNVLIFNENELPAITKRFHKAFNTMNGFGITGMIEKITCNNEYLTNLIKLGGCLIVFNVPKSEIFHSLNILTYMIGFPNCRSQDCNKILEWLDHCFPKDIIKLALLKTQV